MKERNNFCLRDLSLLTHSVGGQIAFTVNVPFGTGKKKHFPKSFRVKNNVLCNNSDQT